MQVKRVTRAVATKAEIATETATEVNDNTDVSARVCSALFCSPDLALSRNAPSPH